jgi:microcompartment protein CcmL/EutN
VSNPADPISAESLAVVELASLARGLTVVDALAKRAPVHIRVSQLVSPGKFLILFVGGVAEVEESFDAALNAASGTLVDKLILPQAHPQILAHLHDALQPGAIDSLGTFETYTAARAVAALDRALKGTEVRLAGLELCRGIGGKGVWVVTGPLFAVQESIEIARASVERDVLVCAEVIASPHPEAIDAYLGAFRRTR